MNKKNFQVEVKFDRRKCDTVFTTVVEAYDEYGARFLARGAAHDWGFPVAAIKKINLKEIR